MEQANPTDRTRPRIRKIDWTEVIRLLDEAPAGTPFLVGRLHRSVATQINKGRYAYIDPGTYQAWTANTVGNTSDIWMRRNK